ncbi:hypothetical protein N9L19_00850 [bacterium]|nr:hypothetical protein [bacterium]
MLHRRAMQVLCWYQRPCTTVGLHIQMTMHELRVSEIERIIIS